MMSMSFTNCSLTLNRTDNLYTIVGGADCSCEHLRPAGIAKCYSLVHSVAVQIALYALFSITVIAALVGNSIVIWTILRHPRMRTATNCFLLNLAVADACISLLNVTFSFTFNLYYDWQFGHAYCYVNNFLSVTPTCASSATLMVMSWERYLAIVHPLRRVETSKSRTLITIGMIWLFAAASGVPNTIATQYYTYYRLYDAGRYKQQHICNAGNFKFLWLESYNYYLLVVQYVLPLLVLSYTYLCIARTLWWQDSTLTQSATTEQLMNKRKVVRMLGTVVLIFMICWLPYHLYFITYATINEAQLLNDTQLEQLYLLIYWLAMSTPVWPPIIYYNMNKRFNLAFKYVFRWLPWSTFDSHEYLSSDLFTKNGITTFRHTTTWRATPGSSKGAASEHHYPSVGFARGAIPSPTSFRSRCASELQPLNSRTETGTGVHLRGNSSAEKLSYRKMDNLSPNFDGKMSSLSCCDSNLSAPTVKSNCVTSASISDQAEPAVDV